MQLPVERGLEGEVEAASVLTVVRRPSVSAVLMRRALANRQFLDEELIEGFDAIVLLHMRMVASSTSNARGIRSVHEAPVLDAARGSWSGMDSSCPPALPRSRGASNG